MSVSGILVVFLKIAEQEELLSATWGTENLKSKWADSSRGLIPLTPTRSLDCCSDVFKLPLLDYQISSGVENRLEWTQPDRTPR